MLAEIKYLNILFQTLAMAIFLLFCLVKLEVLKYLKLKLIKSNKNPKKTQQKIPKTLTEN